MAGLLTRAAGAGIQPAYVARLLDAFVAEGIKPAASQPLTEPLTSHELEVLQLTAQGHSNQQIADRLYLTVNTVKGHNRNIFRKLEVQSPCRRAGYSPRRITRLINEDRSS